MRDLFSSTSSARGHDWMKKAQTLKIKPPRHFAPRKRQVHAQDPLSELEEAGLVRRTDEFEPAYLFKHALTQESAYQSLLHSTRRSIHLRVASIYENLYPDQLDEYAALLARHYAEGGDLEHELVYEMRAGDVSTRLFANAEAIGHYARALEIAKDLDATGSESLRNLYLRLGRVFELGGQYDRALEHYGEMETLGMKRKDRAMKLDALIAIANIRTLPTAEHDAEKAKELSDQALVLAREIGDHDAEARILRSLMILSRWAGEPDKGVVFGEQSLAIARKYRLQEQTAFTLNDLVVHGYANTGQFDRALAVGQEAQQIWQEQNNLPMLADSYSSLAVVQYPLGNYDEVVAASERAWQISERIGNAWGQAYSRWMLGDVYSDRGELEHAIQITQTGIKLGEQAGFAGAEVGGRNLLATVCAHYGLIDLGLEVAQKSAMIANQRFSSWAPWSHATLARLYARKGMLGDAETAMRRAIVGATESVIGRFMILHSSQMVFADVEIALAKNDSEASALANDRLIDHLHRTGARTMLPEALYLRGKIELARDRIDSAQVALTQAREAGETLMLRRMLWQIYAALAEIQTRRGNMSEARQLRDEACKIIEYITEHSTEEQRAAFLSLPAVRAMTAT